MASKLELFSLGTSTTSAIDTLSSGITSDQLTALNTKLQLAAAGAAALNTVVGPAGAGAAYVAGMGALTVQLTKFSLDKQSLSNGTNGITTSDITGDFFGVVSDVTIVAGAVISAVPGLAAAAPYITALGSLSDVASVALNDANGLKNALYNVESAFQTATSSALNSLASIYNVASGVVDAINGASDIASSISNFISSFDQPMATVASNSGPLNLSSVSYDTDSNLYNYVDSYGVSGDIASGQSAAGVPNEQVQTTNGDGSQTDAVFGQGAQATLNNASINLEQGASAGLKGDGNSINAASGTSITLAGNLNSIIGPSSGPCSIDDNDPNTTVIIGLSPPPPPPPPGGGYDNPPPPPNDNLTFQGNSVTVNVLGNVSGTFNGSNNILDLTADADDGVIIAGTGIVVNGDSGDDILNFNDDGTSATVNGGGEVGLLGSNQSVTLGDPGSMVNVAANLGGEFVNAASDTIDFAGGDTANLTGSRDVLDFNGSGDYSGVYGTDQTVNGDTSGNSINVAGDNSSVTVNGDGGYTGILSSGDQVTLSGSGDNLVTAPDIGNIGVTGTDYTIGLANNVSGNFAGTGETINLNGNDSGGISGGSGITLNNDVNSDGFNIGSNTQVTITGSGGYFGVTGTGVDVTASGESSNTVYGASYTLDGDGNNLTVGPNSSAVVTGSNDTLSLVGGDSGGISGGTGDVIDNDDAGDGFNIGSNTQVTITGSGGYFGVTGTGVVVDADGETSYTIPNAEYALNGNNNILSLAPGTTVYSNGTGDEINMTAASGDYAAVTGAGTIVNSDTAGNSVNVYTDDASATVNGDGGYVGILSSGDQVTLGGSGDNLLTAGGISGIGVTGTDYTIGLASGDTGTYGGSNFTLNLSGANSGEIQSGIGNVLNNDVAGDSFNLDSNTQTTITGSGGYFGITGTNVDIDASNETADTWSGVSFNLQGQGDNVYVGGSSSATMGGADNTLNIAGNSGTSAGVYGTGEVVTGDNGSDVVNLGGSGTDATVYGGGYVGLTTSNETITAGDAGTTVAFAPDVQSEEVNGNNITVDANGVTYGNLVGNGDVFNDGDNGGTYYGIQGSGDTINATNDKFEDIDQGSLTLNGPGDTLNLHASSDTIDSSAGDTINVGAGQQAEGIYGSGTTVDLAANSGSSAGIQGAGIIVNGDSGNDLLNLNGDSTNAVIYGNGQVGLLAANQSVALQSSGAALEIHSGFVNESVSGVGDVFQEDSGSQAQLYGQNDIVYQTANTGDYLGINGSGITVSSAGGDEVAVNSGSSATVIGSAGAQIIVDGNDATVTAEGSNDNVSVSNANLTGDVINVTADNEIVNASNATINVSSGEDVYVNGADDKIVLSGNNSNSTADINGNYDTVDSTGNSIVLLGTQNEVTEIGANTVYLNGNGETINGNGAGGLVNLANNVSAYIHNDNVTVHEGQYDDVQINGSYDYVETQPTSGTYQYSNGTGNHYTGNTSNAFAEQQGTGAFQGNEASSYNNSSSDVSYVPYDESLNSGDQNNGGDPGGSGVFYAGSGDYGGGGGYNNGSYDYDAPEDDEGDGGDPDFASVDQAIALKSTSPFTGSDLSSVAADQGLAQAQLAAQSTHLAGAATTAVFEGPVWQAPTSNTAPSITWSFAADPSSPSDPFSGYIGAQYQSTVERAVQAWAAASGLTFQEVPDSAASDLRIGWGDFDTTDSGLLGYTSTSATNGGFNSGTVIRLEDPSETALTTNAGGDPTYAGSNATLYQVALHEIGHALGLADDADPNSVMSTASSAMNRTLDETDISGVQMLYVTLPTSGTGGTTIQASAPQLASAPTASSQMTGVNLMIQAMAGFGAQSSSMQLATGTAQNAGLEQLLAAPLHH